MCGILGSIGTKYSDEQLKAQFDKGLRSIAHRGPDDQGLFVDQGTALGHVRLSIIDLETGSQPMHSQDGRTVIVFNGEIYNYLELREQLEHQGVSFTTHSDTEVLLHGYDQWGEQVVDKLNGMFAFAIYDKKKKTLFCARDPYGQKPFYYFLEGSVFHFSSELKGFYSNPGFKKEICLESVAHYLRFESFQFDRTIFRQTKKLPPGHAIKWAADSALKIYPYYSNLPTSHLMEDKKSPSDLKQTLREGLHKSVRQAFRADVPVAVLLSGGLDSSIVLALAKKEYPDTPIEAFHLRNLSESFDESEYARKVCKALDVKLHTLDLDQKRLAELAQTVPQKLDEPQADPGILPKFEISREIRKNYKVALTGDGADEFFLGYLIFKAEKLASIYKCLPDFAHNHLVRPLAGMLPSTFGYMSLDFISKQFLKGFPGSDALRALKWMEAFTYQDLQRILNISENDLTGAREGEKWLEQVYGEPKTNSNIDRLAYRMQRSYLPDYVLPNSDRASMLNSIELRAPLLDVDLVKFANSIPPGQRMKGLELKSLFKQVAEEYLPKDVVYRKKVGFTAPIGELIRGALRPTIEQTLSSDVLKRQGILNHDAVGLMIKRHMGGQENLYKPIWTLYSLQTWLAENL